MRSVYSGIFFSNLRMTQLVSVTYAGGVLRSRNYLSALGFNVAGWV